MTGSAGAAFNAPMQMGTDMRKRVSISLDLETAARAGDGARKRKTSNSDREELGPFCAWIVRQFTSLEFLCPENREFLSEILTHLGRPWNIFDVLDFIVSLCRKEVRAGRLRPFFCPEQVGRSRKSGAL